MSCARTSCEGRMLGQWLGTLTSIPDVNRPQQLAQAPVDLGSNVSSTQRNPAATHKLLCPSGPRSHSCEMVFCGGVADVPGTRSHQACQQLFSSIFVPSSLLLPPSIIVPCPAQSAGCHIQPASCCSAGCSPFPVKSL